MKLAVKQPPRMSTRVAEAMRRNGKRVGFGAQVCRQHPLDPPGRTGYVFVLRTGTMLIVMMPVRRHHCPGYSLGMSGVPMWKRGLSSLVKIFFNKDHLTTPLTD